MSNILQDKFSENKFSEYISNHLPDFQLTDSRVETRKGFSSVKQIGESPELDLVIFTVTPDSSIHARMEISRQSYALLKTHPRAHALIAYHSDNTDEWRLSLITTQVTRDKNGVKETVSNPRRYSYVLGPSTKVNTPTKYLITKGKIIDLNDLKERFSLEIVNKDFYREISRLFTKLTGGTFSNGRRKEEYKAMLKLPSVPEGDQKNLEFAVRLIGRVIFCWFLREKKSQADISLIPKELLSLDALTRNPDYYHLILEPIFFEVLNKHTKSRKDSYIKTPFSYIPYLNGGLFSPDFEDYFSYNDEKQKNYHDALNVPDEWLRDFFTFLETYNFTIDENVSFDEELSIDPEMLGRIFENLLAEINPETGESARKNTGSYYTPRSIVEYMVDESLFVYLAQKTNLEESKLRAIISYDLEDNANHSLKENEPDKVINALSTIKILDPACGSGAFPIGALQKIVFILQQIDPSGRKWFEKQLINTAPEIKRVIEREFANKNFNYIRKLGVIRENIFGVDIQSIATEISRLRCFLTLVVDESVHDELENRGIEPLPNLDFKFVTANTLVQLPGSEEQTLFKDEERIDQLKDLRSEFFSSTNSERHRLQLEFRELQNQMLDRMIETKGEDEFTRTLSTWNPFSHRGSLWFDPEWMFGVEAFDIVITNPPYISVEKFAHTKIQEEWKKNFKTYASRGDVYCFFYEKGISLLGDKGILTFISSNKFQRAGYGTNLRQLLASQKIHTLIDFCELPVFSAATDPMIVIATKTLPTAQDVFPVLVVKNEREINSLSLSVRTRASVYNHKQLSISGWSLEGSEQIALVEKLRNNGIPLGEYVRGDIMAGIKTGFNKAFWLEISDVHQLTIADAEAAAKYIKPLLLGDDARRWIGKATTKFIIYTPRGTNVDDLGKLKDHLGRWKERLSQRALDQEWFELQQAQLRYSETYAKPKIVYPDIALEPRFFLDTDGRYPDMTAFSIPSSDYSLLALLNSRTLWFFLCRTAAVLGDADNRGRVRCKTQYISKLPIPPYTSDEKALLEELAKKAAVAARDGKSQELIQIQQSIDEIVYRLFNLTKQEIQLVEGKI